MNWQNTILMILCGVGAVICFGIMAVVKLTPPKYENCVLKPRGYNTPKKPRRPRTRQPK